MGAEVEPRHDTEVAPATAQRPEQVGMRAIIRLDHLAAGGDHLRADELIGGETPGAHHPADAAPEGEPAHTDRLRVTGAHSEPVLCERRGDVSPHGAAADP